MKKLLVLVFALIAVIGLVFAVSAADAQKLTGLGDVVSTYDPNGTEVAGGGWNGGSYDYHAFDGSYGSLYNNTAGRYFIVDLNAKLAGGYYVSDVKVFHAGNTKYSLYYTNDGSTWKPLAQGVQVTEATYAVNDIAVQVKYVFDSVQNWVPSLQEVEIYGIDPSELACTHGNLTEAGWVEVPGSATCTTIGNQTQTCPDCGEVFVRESADVPALGHDIITTITRPGTNISYGAATLTCSRCDYTIDFSGEVNLTDGTYSSLGASQQFVNIIVSSCADLWGASVPGNLTDGKWTEIGPFHTWVAAGEDDALEYVLLNFQGAIDLTKLKVLVQNDSGGTLVLSALNDETGEYEVVKELQTYDANISGGGALVMEIPMLGITTSSLKIQAFSNWRNANGYYYNRMVIGELEAFGIAEGCGLDADNHECQYDTFVDYVVAPTCQTAGTATYKCACNATTVYEVAASEEFHNYIEVEGTRVNSTCTVAGSYTGKCEYCEAETTISLDVDGENGHTYEEIGRTNADCVNAGSIEYKCANCEATKTEEIPALGHTYGEAVVVPSDCKNNGTSTKTCTVCGNEEVTTLETTGCTWTLGEIITEPTCGAEGEANYVCSVCGETKVDVVAATGNHTWDEENVNITLAPSCTTTGAGDYTCTVCGKVEKKVVAALGHDWTEATCTAKSTCLNCGMETGEMLEHTPGENGWAPSCWRVGCCGVCGQEYGELLEHVWFEEPQTSAATCIAEGKIYQFCMNDGCFEENVLQVLPIDTQNGHQMSWMGPKEEVVATCNKEGYAIFDCDLCGAVDVKVTTPADPETYHFATDWEGNFTNLVLDEETYKVLTCQNAGYAKYTCPTCNDFEYVVEQPIDPEDLQHVWGEGVEIDGGYHYECELCDATKDEITQGTDDDPITAKPGDNDLVYFATGNDYVVYQFITSDAGTVTVTVDAGAGIFFGYAWELNYGEEYMTGETTYTFEADGAGEYPIIFSLDGDNYTIPETFNVSFVGVEYPELALGENNYTLGDWENYECVVSVPGNYTMTATNALIYLPEEEGSPAIESFPYEFTVAQGERVKFRIFTESFVAGDVSVTLVNPDNALLNGTYTDSMNSALFVFEDGKLTITDTNAMMPSGFAGTYTYNYTASTGAIVLDSAEGPALSVNTYTGEILLYGRMPLAVYVPPIELVIGENVIEVTDAWNGTKTVVTAPGTYILSAPEGTTPYVVVEMGNANAVIEEYPYEFTVTKDQKVTIVVLESTTLTLAEKPSHTHTEVEIPAIRPTPSTVGYTAGIVCSECGETIKAPEMVVVSDTPSWKEFGVGATDLILGNNISVDYHVNVSAGYNNPYVVFVFEGKEYVVTDYTLNSNNGRYIYNFAETRPHKIAETIIAYVYGETEDGYVRDVYEYSVMQYCLSKLSKNEAELTTVVSDLLMYGALTQQYVDSTIAPEKLVTNIAAAAGYTLTPSTFTSIPEGPKAQYTGVEPEGIMWASASVVVGNSTEITYKFKATDITGLKIKIEVDGVEKMILDAADLEYKDGRYIVNVNCISSVQYACNVTATFVKDGVASGSVTYSINNFLYNNLAKNEGTVLGDLMKAVYLYGQSVYNYIY